MQVLSLFPSSGPTLGAVVTITGSGFLPSNSLVCRVFGVMRPVSLVSSTQALCYLYSVSSAQSTSVEVSNNKQQFTNDNKVFTFYGKFCCPCSFLFDIKSLISYRKSRSYNALSGQIIWGLHCFSHWIEFSRFIVELVQI